MESKADHIFNDLRGRLFAEEWGRGERLPSERALSENYGAHRASVRGAVGRLAMLGLVTVRRGDGIRATGERDEVGLDLIGHLLEASLSEDIPLDTVRDLLEVRRLVASEAVAMACTRITPEVMAHLTQLAGEQALRVEDEAAFAAGDIEFARTLLKASGNWVLELLLITISRFYLVRPEVGRAMYSDRPMVVASYYGVLSLIGQGDLEQARTLVRSTLEQLDKETLKILGEGR
jgi:GntR family transcriptional regulator, transcriptional repressor for pyruvate dehydrogenase complex